MDTFIEILKLGIVGLIAGLFSSYLSNRDHRSKKWWELRVYAYQSVIEALSDLNHYYEISYSAEITQRDLSVDQEKELRITWNEGYSRVRKAADSGAFLFSPHAEEALNAFMKSHNKNYESYFEYLDNSYAEAKKCLKSLVMYSKNDLSLKHRFWGYTKK